MTNSTVKTIDHATADFDRATMTRGFATAAGEGSVVYCRKVDATTAEVIVDDGNGMYGFSCFSRNSAKRTADGIAENIAA